MADFELIGFDESGLDLIEELRLGPQSILVTSRFEERHIMEACQRLQVRMIPKGIAGFVPICMSKSGNVPDAVLIDDDNLVHRTWKRTAKRRGRTLLAFSNSCDFFREADGIPRIVPVYVDANLGEDVRGEAIAKQIHDLGFENVYLATGYEPGQFHRTDFLAWSDWKGTSRRVVCSRLKANCSRLHSTRLAGTTDDAVSEIVTR